MPSRSAGVLSTSKFSQPSSSGSRTRPRASRSLVRVSGAVTARRDAVRDLADGLGSPAAAGGGVLRDDLRWTEAFPWLVRTGQDRKLRRLLEEAEATHRAAAARFRALGRDDQARRAQQFAAWVRLDLDEPQAARRLYSAARNLRGVTAPGARRQDPGRGPDAGRCGPRQCPASRSRDRFAPHRDIAAATAFRASSRHPSSSGTVACSAWSPPTIRDPIPCQLATWRSSSAMASWPARSWLITSGTGRIRG